MSLESNQLDVASSLQALAPRRTDRALFVGQTGSGKTTLARYLLAQRRFVVLVDMKGMLKWSEYQVATTLRELQRLADSGTEKLCYRPDYGESQNATLQNRFWHWIYQRRHTTVYVDETAAVTNGDQFPYYYGACFMRGRELGIEVWSATQRPMRIPQVVLSESEHVYAFRLRLPQDRQRVEQLTGIDADQIAALRKHEFLYAPQDGEVFGPLKLGL